MGFVLKGNKIVEVENKCSDPINGFEVSGSDLAKYYDDVIASWHTHPDVDTEITAEDYKSFLNYPHWVHYIINTKGVFAYKVEDGIVVPCND